MDSLSLYDISCFAAGSAGNVLHLSHLQVTCSKWFGKTELLISWEFGQLLLQATSLPSLSSCHQCKHILHYTWSRCVFCYQFDHRGMEREVSDGLVFPVTFSGRRSRGFWKPNQRSNSMGSLTCCPCSTASSACGTRSRGSPTAGSSSPPSTAPERCSSSLTFPSSSSTPTAERHGYSNFLPVLNPFSLSPPFLHTVLWAKHWNMFSVSSTAEDDRAPGAPGLRVCGGLVREPRFLWPAAPAAVRWRREHGIAHLHVCFPTSRHGTPSNQATA